MNRAINSAVSAAMALGTLMALTACSADTLFDNRGDGGQTVITAVLSEGENVNARSCVDPNDYQSGEIGILWTADDQLGVYTANGAKNILFATTNDQQNWGRAQFYGNVATGDAPQYAYYPYSADNNGRDLTSLKGVLPLEQTYSMTTRRLDGDYKVGTPRTDAPDEFLFNHLFSMVRFNINASGTALEGEKLQSITMTLPEGRVLGGEFTFGITGTPAPEFTSATGANAVTVKWEDEPELNSGSAYTGYMTCAPDVHAGDLITVTVLCEYTKVTFTAEAAADFSANAFYHFDLTLSKYKDSASWKEEPVKEKPGEITTIADEDPVTGETANCYMITQSGVHSFPGNVIGNGEAGIIAGAGFHTDTPYINPSSARLLWEDTKGFITDVQFDAVKKRVIYTANGNVGNALIAVSNGTGSILWSWHIWGVGNTLPADEEFTNHDGSVAVMMDCNLGSLDKSSLDCMMYQWGRKDPFPSVTSLWIDDKQTDVTVFPNKQFDDTENSKATIAYSIAHPGSMMNVKSNWLNADMTELWGDNKKGSKEPSRTNEMAYGKTIYDPSPVGYRVASSYAYTGFVVNPSIYSSGVANFSKSFKGIMGFRNDDQYDDMLKEYLNCIVEFVDDEGVVRYYPKGFGMKPVKSDPDDSKIMLFGDGYYFKRNSADKEGIFFPQSGYRNHYGELVSYGCSGHYYMATDQSNANQAYYLEIGWFHWSSSDYKYTLTENAGNHGSINARNFCYKNLAKPVRCVRY